MQYIPVRKVFWDSLEYALNSQMQRLAKEISDTLGVSEAPLMNALKDSTKVYLFDEAPDQVDITEMRCQHPIPMSEFSPYLKACGAPVVWTVTPGGRDRCIRHSLEPQPMAKIPVVKKIAETEYILEGDSIHLEDRALVGRYNPETNTAFVFEIN